MQKTARKQQGLTLISLIFVLGFISFFVLLVFKVAPIYMEHGKVTSALETLKKTPNVENLSKGKVWSRLYKQFGMNYVYHVTKKDVKITSYPGYLKVKIVYDVKEPLFANLSVWVDFDNEIEKGIK